jgi:hypothetical protein
MRPDTPAAATILPCGPSATTERLRRRRTFCGLDKELRNRDRQCLGETIQNVDSRVFLSPLKTTNVGPIYTSIKGQTLLREAASHPDAPQVPSYQRAPFHALRRALCGLSNHWPYPVNYGELPCNAVIDQQTYRERMAMLGRMGAVIPPTLGKGAAE